MGSTEKSVEAAVESDWRRCHVEVLDSWSINDKFSYFFRWSDLKFRHRNSFDWIEEIWRRAQGASEAFECDAGPSNVQLHQGDYNKNNKSTQKRRRRTKFRKKKKN